MSLQQLALQFAFFLLITLFLTDTSTSQDEMPVQETSHMVDDIDDDSLNGTGAVDVGGWAALPWFECDGKTASDVFCFGLRRNRTSFPAGNECFVNKDCEVMVTGDLLHNENETESRGCRWTIYVDESLVGTFDKVGSSVAFWLSNDPADSLPDVDHPVNTLYVDGHDRRFDGLKTKSTFGQRFATSAKDVEEVVSISRTSYIPKQAVTNRESDTKNSRKYTTYVWITRDHSITYKDNFKIERFKSDFLYAYLAHRVCHYEGTKRTSCVLKNSARIGPTTLFGQPVTPPTTTTTPGPPTTPTVVPPVPSPGAQTDPTATAQPQEEPKKSSGKNWGLLILLLLALLALLGLVFFLVVRRRKKSAPTTSDNFLSRPNVPSNLMGSTIDSSRSAFDPSASAFGSTVPSTRSAFSAFGSTVPSTVPSARSEFVNNSTVGSTVGSTMPSSRSMFENNSMVGSTGTSNRSLFSPLASNAGSSAMSSAMSSVDSVNSTSSIPSKIASKL